MSAISVLSYRNVNMDFVTWRVVEGFVYDSTEDLEDFEGRECLYSGRSEHRQVMCAEVARRMAKFRKRAGLDLSDPLTGEVEVSPDLFEGSGLAVRNANTSAHS